MDVSSLPRVPMLAALVACSTLSASDALAATFTVGTGSGCTHATLGAAITAAENSAGADTIRLTRSIAYSQVAATITTAQELTITGGFDTCTQATSDGIATVLDGTGGAAAPVLRINGNTGSIVRLDTLTLRGGDVGGTGYGGGIYFRGNGILEIQRSTIMLNTAGYGGGIYAEGTSDRAELVIGANVLVNSNTARYSGGGIYVEGLEMTMVDPGSSIAFNKALGTGNEGGYGGGLMLLSGASTTVATLGTTGLNNLGVLYGNEARYGGGAAVVAADDVDRDVTLVVNGVDPETRTRVRSNFASVAGGGLYARSDIDGVIPTYHDASIHLQNFELSDNEAPDGAAAYMDYDNSIINGDAPSSLSLFPASLNGSCPPSKVCGVISGNKAGDGTNVTNGAIVHTNRSYLYVNESRGGPNPVNARAGLLVRGNRGGSVIRSTDGIVNITNALISDNVASQQVITKTDDYFFTILRAVTIAGNEIGSPHVVSLDGNLILSNTLIWQPGKTTLQSSGGSLTVQSVIASEVASLNAGPEAQIRPPRFTDPARGDYTLRAASQAMDAAPALSGVQSDALGRPRVVDLPFAANFRGPFDVGAFERQTLLPIVLNGNFDADMNLWAQVTPGSSWVSDQNASGATGSGSILVNATNVSPPRFVARSQCVHLPGPGRYLLNGYGRSSGTTIANRDSTLLHWELRHGGLEACTDGAPNASGDHFLGASTSWRRPDTPAVIDLTPAQWTNTSSLTVYLVVYDNGVVAPPNNSAVGWFDGITLEVVEGDIIFQDDFDP